MIFCARATRGLRRMDRERPGALLARRTRTVKRCSSDQENKVPVSASLVYSVEFGKMGCKENWTFGGGKLSLVGKAHNFVGGAEMRTLHVNLKK